MPLKERKVNEVWRIAELYKQFWEEKYVPEVYHISGLTLKWAKELVGVDNDTIYARFQIYADDPWYGENTRHSIQAFVKNFNSFVPKKAAPKVERRSTYHCPDCDTDHKITDPCPPKVDSMSVVSSLTQRMKP